MPKPPEKPSHVITHDIPMPGFYPVLTMQLNVTRYQSEGLGKFVLTVREPTEQIELKRVFVNVEAWDIVAKSVRVAIADAIADLLYMQTGENP